MKQSIYNSILVNYTLLFSLVLFGKGCGVVVGNPDGSETEETIDVPKIAIELPKDDGSGTYLTKTNSNILMTWMNRARYTVEKINETTDYLNEYKLTIGDFKNLGEDQLLSGRISKTSNSDLPPAFCSVL